MSLPQAFKSEKRSVALTTLVLNLRPDMMKPHRALSERLTFDLHQKVPHFTLCHFQIKLRTLGWLDLDMRHLFSTTGHPDDTA